MKKEPIVLLTHGGWGTSLLESIRMILGKTESVYEVAIQVEDSLFEYKSRVEAMLNSLDYTDKLLILTDIRGGTTSNVALALSKFYPLIIVSGLSSPLLLECILAQEKGGYTESLITEIMERVSKAMGIVEIGEKGQ